MTISNATVHGQSNPERKAGAIQGVLVLLASVMPVMAIVSLIPVLPLLAREFSGVQGSVILVPMALTVPALCVAIFSPLAGWIADRVGRKWLLVTALLIYAGIGILPYFLTDLVQIIIARAGLGISEAVIMTVATTLIADYFTGERRERWVGGQMAVVSFSAIVLIAVGGALGEAFGSRGPFLLYLLAVPIALLVSIFLFEPQVKTKDSQTRQALPFSRILLVILITFLSSILFYTTMVKLGAILELSGDRSPGTIGLVGAAANAGVMLGALLFSRFKRASGPTLVCMGLFLITLGYVGMGLSGIFEVSAAFAVVTCIGSGLLLPTLLTWVMQLLPEPVRGRGTGLWTGTFFLGQFIAPIIASALEGPAGGLANVLLIWSGVAFVGAVVAAMRIRGAVALRELQPA